MAKPVKRVIVVLLFIVLLPALFYSGYEINSLSSSEKLIEEVYSQQLDVILYSLNQFSWEVGSTWASSIAMLRREHGRSQAELDRSFDPFFAKNSPVKAVVFTDSTLENLHITAPPTEVSLHPNLRNQLQKLLGENRAKLQKLADFRRVEYRKIEPLIVTDSRAGTSRLLLMFATGEETGSPGFAGMVIDERSFVQDVLIAKLRDVAGNEFIAAVFSGNDAQPVFATEPIQEGAVKQKKLLWIFPEYTVGIALKGASVQDILRGRFYRSIGLFALLDLVLIAGVWFVYRSVRREVEFARLKSDFVSSVSHELRTPLALIRMYAETLEMGRLHDEAKKQEYYATILGETERLTRLINNILSFSRMEAGKRQFHMHPVDLNAVASGVIDTYSRHLENEGFTVNLVPSENLPWIKGDKEAISEALINIIDNAMKYSDKDKTIRVSVGSRPSGIYLEVEDHGVGIAPEHQKKIFETFYRVSSGLVQKTRGSGLGLAMVKQIMDAHGGNVELESTLGKGSTFRLEFPIPGQT